MKTMSKKFTYWFFSKKIKNNLKEVIIKATKRDKQLSTI